MISIGANAARDARTTTDQKRGSIICIRVFVGSSDGVDSCMSASDWCSSDDEPSDAVLETGSLALTFSVKLRSLTCFAVTLESCIASRRSVSAVKVGDLSSLVRVELGSGAENTAKRIRKKLRWVMCTPR